MNKRKTIGVLLGLVGFFLPWFIELPGLSFPGQVTLGVFLLAAAFWLFEPVPIYSTSMLVIFLEVLLLSAEGPLQKASAPPGAAPQTTQTDGVFRIPASAFIDDSTILVSQPGARPSELDVEVGELVEEDFLVTSDELSTTSIVVSQPDHWTVSYKPSSYRIFFGALADPIIILFLGGCLLANASVKYRLDRSLTRLFLKPVGSKPTMIVLGLMVATGVLSAFMSNTATTAMMMTVVLPLLAQLPEDDPLRVAIVLAIPVGANIGGITTPIGTPPNAIALSAMTNQGINISFGQWVILALPIVAVTMFIGWIILMKLYPARATELKVAMEGKFDKSPRAIGLYAVFAATAILWFTEKQHGIKSNIVAFLPVVVLPMFGIVGKKEIRSLPWDVFWLMAGGISLGTAIKTTGLAEWMVGSVEWSALNAFVITAGMALLAYAMANFLSHTVTVTLLAPIAISVGSVIDSATGFSLTTTLVAVAVASSYGMALPISTPPNAIAMGSGAIEARHLLKAGGVIGIIGIALVLLLAKFYWPLFG